MRQPRTPHPEQQNAESNCADVEQDSGREQEGKEASRESQASQSGIVHSAKDASISVDEEQRILGRFAQSTIDALSTHLCVLDESGTILVTNQAWRLFAEANPASVQGGQPGDNYLQACDAAIGSESAAAAFAKGIRAVIRGERAEFVMEYPCHSLSEQRCFVGRVTRFSGDGPVRVVVAHENITERKRAEAALDAERNLLRTLIDLLPDYIYVKDSQSRFLACNEACARLMGAATTAELIGKTDADFYPARMAAKFRADELAVLEGTSLINKEEPLTRPNGTHEFIVTTKLPIKDSSGMITGLVGYGRNVTASRQSEEARRSTEERYSSLFEHAPDGIAITGPEGCYVDANDSVCRMLGYARDELIGLQPADIVAPAEMHRIGPALALIKAGENYLSEWQLRRRDGSVFTADVMATMMPDGNRLAIIRDITERKRVEQRIQQLNRVYAVLTEINETIVRENDLDAVLAAACQIAVGTGKFRMAWIGVVDAETHTVKPVASAGVVDGYLDDLNIDLRDEAPSTGPTSRAIRSGAHITCDDIENDPHFAPWRDEALRRGYRASAAFPLRVDGNLVGTFNLYSHESGIFNEEELRLLDQLAMDIGFALELARRLAERQKSEVELRWKTAFFEAQVDSALDGILVVDSNGRKILQNQRLNELWKIPPHISENEDDAAQVKFISSHTKNPEQFAEKVAYLYSHPAEISQDLVELIDGTVLERYSSPVRDKTGKYYGRIWAFRDITERKQLEDQLRQSQKLEAIGRLAGGVAHDFNNLLTVINGYSDLTLMKLREDDPLHRNISEVRKAAERAAGLTRQLLAFSRKQVLQPKVLDLNRVVSELEKMLGRLIGEDIELRTVLEADLGSVKADPGQIEQIIMNLAVNARDAMPRGGKLTVETKNVYRDEDYAKHHIAVIPGPYVMLAVSDTGIGIDQQTQARIFEPFFTTKEIGKGTGLGLSTVYGIVKQSGGNIWVYSEVGLGTTFKVYLPRVDEGMHKYERSAETDRAVQGAETILLAEDEELVRRLSRQILEMYGYQVLEAANGGAAFLICERYEEPIHLLITDIIMPEMGGRELADRLAQLRPEMKVLYMSGYTDSAIVHQGVLDEGANFIQKPFPTDALARKVREVLDAPGKSH